jgi:hypothetical protein
VAEFWVGIRGDLTTEEIGALKAAGIVVADLRMSAAGWGEPPTEWKTLRTFVPVPAADESEAKAVIAEAVGLEADDLVVYSADVFR